MIRRTTCLIVAWITLCAGTARAVPWPVADTGAVHEIWHAYGQWLEPPFGAIHLHEGIDLPLAIGTEVRAVARGRIVELVNTGNAFNRLLTIADVDGADNATGVGWGYVHVNPVAGLRVGDLVTVGQRIGTVADAPDPLLDHLHWERVSDANGGWPNAGGGTPHLLDDPVNFAMPNTDTRAPTIEGTLFRRAEDEGNDRDPRYMTRECCDRLWIGSRAPNGSGNIDVLVSAYDYFGAFTTHKLSVQEVSWHANGRLGDNVPFDQVMVNFEGTFAQHENDNFSRLFRSAAFAQTIYENDTRANSANGGPFWYIATNQDEDHQPEIGDAAWFWDTDGLKTEPLWNDNAANDERAPNNAKSKFRDDFYQIVFNVLDEANNVRATTRETVLDNWEQTVQADKFLYWIGETVFEVTGAQHQASDPSVPLYVVDNRVDCTPIPALGIEGAAVTTSDADGILAGPVAVWTTNKLGYFYLISDYDDDGIWHPKLDGSDPLIVVAHKWFRLIPPFIVTTGPSTPIRIEVSPRQTGPAVEITQITLQHSSTPGIFVQASTPSPPNEFATATMLDVVYNPEGPQPLPSFTQMDLNVNIHDAMTFDTGLLVDPNRDGTIFNITFTPTSFEITWEILVPNRFYQFWLLTSQINPLLADSLQFSMVDVQSMSADSNFNLLIGLQNLGTQPIFSGPLFSMNLSAYYVPLPAACWSGLALMAVLGGARRRRRG